MKKLLAAMMMVTVLSGTAACGGSDDTTAGNETTASPFVETTPDGEASPEGDGPLPQDLEGDPNVVNPKAYDDSDIQEAVGTDDMGYVTIPDGTECEVAVYLTSPEMIDTYVQAGDTVAVNNTYTAGVKVVGDKVCADYFGEKLRELP